MKKPLVLVLFFVMLFIVLIIFLKQPHVDVKKEIQTEKVEQYSNQKEMVETNQQENAKQIDEYIDYEIKNDDHIKVKPSFYYLALGDSLTKGIGDEENKNGFTKRLEEKIENFNVIDVLLDNRGKRGRRSDQLLNLIEKGHYDEEIENADLITITIGGNDIMKIVKKELPQLEKKAFDKGRAEFEKRLSKIVSDIHSQNKQVPILLIGLYNPFATFTNDIPEFDNVLDEWNDTIEQISKNTPNACFVKVDDLFDSNTNMVYHSDFFHPNSYGYTMITERIILSMLECKSLELNQLILMENSSYNKR